MLVDEIEVELFAGDGGRGAVAFNKVKLSRGPTGGDGGRGGNVYVEGVADLTALSAYAHRKEVKAESGKDGRGQFLDGRTGHDVVLKIPIGTSVVNAQTGYARDMEHVGQRILIAAGGMGGKGNFKFRSPVNTTPMEYQEGLPGDHITFVLKLKLIADVGLIGMPNAGKSSFINEFTSVKSKVGAYAFTTLEPHLGSYYGLILADIPGLIEGASDGKGLGIKFLKHVERTRTLFHFISAESDDPVRDYKTIRAELKAYDASLTQKKEYVFLSKIDMTTPDIIKSHLAALKKANITALPISVLDDTTLEPVKKLLNELKEEKMSTPAPEADES